MLPLAFLPAAPRQCHGIDASAVATAADASAVATAADGAVVEAGRRGVASSLTVAFVRSGGHGKGALVTRWPDLTVRP